MDKFSYIFSIYISLVIQSQPIGTDIFTASATDADGGSNGRITYSIVSPPVSET